MIKLADSHIHMRDIRFAAVEKMLDTIYEVGVREACLLSIPYCSVAYDLSALYAKMKYKKMPVRAFGGLHLTDRYADIPFEKQVEAMLRLGCDGVKIMDAPSLRRHMGVGYNAPEFEKMFALLEEKQIPVNIHVADPEEFWEIGGRLSDGSYISKQEMYNEIFEILDRHPNLKVCFAHFFFLSNYPEEAVRVMEKYQNVYFDLTPGTEMYYNFDNNIEFWHSFFTKYSHRILHGTDCNTYKDFNKELELLVYRKLSEGYDYFTQNCYGKDFVVRGLNLDEKAIEQIVYKNYFEFMGKEPKKVNEEFFYECCERVLADITAEPTDSHYKRSMPLFQMLRDDPTQQRAVAFCKEVLENRKKL